MEMDCPAALSECAGFEVPDRMVLDGPSATALRLREVARTLARTTIPVVIIGEPGSGTEVLAYAIHCQSPESAAPFTLLSSESLTPSFFSVESALGPDCPLAQPGTVVLDRVCELSAASQNAFLELLSTSESPCRARLLICTDRELEEEVRRGRIRQDLVRHFGQVFVRVPALRQRREDIAYLASCMAEKYAIMFNRPNPSLGPQLIKVLEDSSWPGNMRDLDAAVRMIVLVGDERVSIAALRSAGREERNGPANRIPLKETSRAASRAAEREVIQKVLLRNGGNRKVAAQQLQISYKALLYKLKQFGLSIRPSRGDA